MSSRTFSVFLAADAVGYSRLSEKDEAAALAAVSWFRERAQEIVAAHGGRIFFRAGDGVMAQLPTPSAGMKAALELAGTVQMRLAREREPALPVRIGLHLGEVSSTGDGDLLGHDVNVAARLEQIAQAGEVLASRVLADAAKGKVAAGFERLGRERLKNLAEPVEVFRVVAAEQRKRPPLVLLGAVAGAVALAVLGLSYIGGQILQPARQAASVDGASIAVLPFADMSAEGDQEYFSDGLSEELLNQLAQVDGLRVIARTSSFSFKGQNADVRAIGETLGVAHVLEGSVRRSGDRLRINAQLVDARDGAQVWSQSYDRELSDVFEIQDEIAAEVTAALSVALGMALDVTVPSSAPAQQNLDAYDSLLRARHALSLGGAPGTSRAVALYEQAIALDPNSADAWIEFAEALWSWAIFAPPADRPHLLERRDEAIARAVEIAPERPEPYDMRGEVLVTEHDWVGAAMAYDRARRLSPVEARACVDEPMLVALGRDAEQVLQCRLQAVRDDPLSGGASGQLQRIFDLLGRDEEAEAEYRRSFDLEGARGAYEYHAMMRTWRTGGAEEIEAQMRRFIAEMTQAAPVLSQVVPVYDDAEAALALLRPAIDDPANQGPIAIATIATFLAHYGDEEAAVRALRRLYVDEIGYEGIFPWLPVYAEARRTPEFKDLVRDLGMVDYWRATGLWSDFCRPLGADDFECF